MIKFDQTKATYDALFLQGGFEGTYDLPYRHSSYFPLFRRVLKQVLDSGAKSILEVGCGTGGFAHYLMETTPVAYRGFDFSDVAVGKARERTGRAEAFFVGDATVPETYSGQSPDCIVCTEVLEHIESDLEAISHWRPGTFCVCSVPNFDADTHVRFFGLEEEVLSRYGQMIEIKDIARINKPELSDISLRSTLRALRWNRYRPRRLLRILGVGSFESMGGWFMFSGTRKG